MARLLQRGSLLVCLVLLCLLPFDLLAELTFPRSITARKLAYLDRTDLSPVEVALFGSSHVFWGIDPHGLSQKAYNFGDMGDCLFSCEQKFLRYAPRMPRLKTVIVGVDEFMFGAGEMLDTAPDYLRDGFPLAQPSWSTTVQAWLPLIRYRRNVVPQFLASLSGRSVLPVTPTEDSDVPTDPTRMTLLLKSGFLYKPQQMNVTMESARERAAMRYAEYDEARRAASRDALRHIMDLAQARQIKVLLVTTPVLPAYREVCDRHMLAEHEVDVNSVLYDHPSARVLSFWNEAFPIAEYEDPDHLNRLGAEHLTRLLDQEMKEVRVGRP